MDAGTACSKDDAERSGVRRGGRGRGRGGGGGCIVRNWADGGCGAGAAHVVGRAADAGGGGAGDGAGEVWRGGRVLRAGDVVRGAGLLHARVRELFS